MRHQCCRIADWQGSHSARLRVLAVLLKCSSCCTVSVFGPDVAPRARILRRSHGAHVNDYAQWATSPVPARARPPVRRSSLSPAEFLRTRVLRSCCGGTMRVCAHTSTAKDSESLGSAVLNAAGQG
eukprot:scaffold212_cov404-Prasinococcus_capsulatus_cf.AAC.8